MIRRLTLANAYGLALAASFAAAWFALERPASARFLASALLLFVAASVAAVLTRIALAWLDRRPDTSRLAAALLGLFGGTSALASFLLFLVHVATTEIPWDISLGHFVFWTLIQGAGAIYVYLTIVGWLLLPAGVPATLLFAVLLARRPR